MDETVLVHGFAQAVEAAAERAGATAPNPPVGCVILDASGATLAISAHRRAGTAHAEVLALDQCRAAGRLGEAHTMLVTLEPCNRFGRTPPCVRTIVDSPIRSVWIGALDPNLSTPGAGMAELEQAGRSVRLLSSEPGAAQAAIAARCAGLIAPFATWVRTGRPRVIVKRALDASGSMIPPVGRNTFTSPESLRLAHLYRRQADAILTGSGTILADDPEFTVRRAPDHGGKPRRLAILDRRGRTPTAYLHAAEARGMEVTVASDLNAALEALGRLGALSVLVEAGPELTGAVLSQVIWDEQLIIHAGIDGQADRIEHLLRDSPGVYTTIWSGSPTALDHP